MRKSDIIEISGKKWEVVSVGRVAAECVRKDWQKSGFDPEQYFELRYAGPKLPTQPYDITAAARTHIKTGKVCMVPR